MRNAVRKHLRGRVPATCPNTPRKTVHSQPSRRMSTSRARKMKPSRALRRDTMSLKHLVLSWCSSTHVEYVHKCMPGSTRQRSAPSTIAVSDAQQVCLTRHRRIEDETDHLLASLPKGLPNKDVERLAGLPGDLPNEGNEARHRGTPLRSCRTVRIDLVWTIYWHRHPSS